MTRYGLSDVATISGEIIQGLSPASQNISTSESNVWLACELLHLKQNTVMSSYVETLV